MKNNSYRTLKFLMCQPQYFDVDYEINPWMNVGNRPDKILAQKQWLDLKNTYLKLGAEVNLIDPIKDLSDLVFTANAGLVYENIFIPSQFKFRERKGEEPHFIKWFESKGYVVKRLPPSIDFEGEADRILHNDKILMGYGFRSSLPAHKEISKILKKEVIPLELINPNFYHLDTCLAYFDFNDTILYYPKAFSLESQEIIKKEFNNIIQVSDEEAFKYACNSINISDNVVINENCTDAYSKLKKYNYKIYTLNTSEFMKAGGSIKCMTLILS
ncbi:MAG: hypothetical protein A2Y82_01205 [Candidatus Buchananbacteria bacterium RBG_13_36_9]|uniref:Amidinotransferase n=1 Tax=Candidatus Buchananbacteria bacterium RBG_13_36_9 TaxID=1797530 RepID=A0A1G1XNQ9_9BACT|nr:MAG: hypothetical protein A2Y82_01205 [Candidatus Buchananbacteria bacterium RBG_13_36_9]